MSKSDQIRALARSGWHVAQIARDLGVRYQFAYNVCQRAGLLCELLGATSHTTLPPLNKPALTAS